MKLGETFLTNASTSSHLWIVIGINNDGQIALVNLTTKHPNKDESCIIQREEHPFIKHETIAEYRMARPLNPDEVKLPDQIGIRKRFDPVSKSLLERLQKGALASKFTPQNVQQVVRESMQS
jgi:hypothetical protein